MEETTKAFLKEQLIPEHVRLLLELYGVVYMQDIVSLDNAAIEDIELNVREGRFSGQVDFSIKSNRVKYLGFDMADCKMFSFRPIDKKKLVTLSAGASKTLQTSELKKFNKQNSAVDQAATACDLTNSQAEGSPSNDALQEEQFDAPSTDDDEDEWGQMSYPLNYLMKRKSNRS